MKALKVILSTLIAVSMTTTAFADSQIRIGNMMISGGGLQLVGTISTSTADSSSKSFTYIGWTLIVVGMLVQGGDLAVAGEMNASGKSVWDSVVREASVISRAPELAKEDMAITSAAKQMDITVGNLAQLALDIDKEARISESKGNAIDHSLIQTKLFPNGFSNEKQSNAFANMMALATMN